MGNTNPLPQLPTKDEIREAVQAKERLKVHLATIKVSHPVVKVGGVEGSSAFQTVPARGGIQLDILDLIAHADPELTASMDDAPEPKMFSPKVLVQN